MINLALALSAIAVVALGAPSAANAAELLFTCTHALKAVSLELVPLFERATGHKVIMRFDVVGGVKRQIEAGDVFDVACLNPAMVDDLVKQGKLATAMSANIARAGLAVMRHAI